MNGWLSFCSWWTEVKGQVSIFVCRCKSLSTSTVNGACLNWSQRSLWTPRNLREPLLLPLRQTLPPLSWAVTTHRAPPNQVQTHLKLSHAAHRENLTHTETLPAVTCSHSHSLSSARQDRKERQRGGERWVRVPDRTRKREREGKRKRRKGGGECGKHWTWRGKCVCMCVWFKKTLCNNNPTKMAKFEILVLVWTFFWSTLQKKRF